jgi:hypothetical protein
MSALDFPSSPVNGQTFVDGPRIWTFNSFYGVWNITSEGITGPTGYTGSFGTTGYTGSSIGASTNTQIIFNDSGAANGASGFTFIKTTNATSFPGTLAAGNTTITGFANVSTTLQVGTNTATFGTAVYIIASGNTGIGTSSPASLFHVKRGSNATETYPTNTWAARIINATDANTENGLVVGNRWAAAESTVFEAGSIYGGGTGVWSSYYKITGGGTHIWGAGAAGAEKMRIDANGNTGIGNSAPTTKLSVNGTTFLGGTLAAGNTTITGFANVSTTLQVGTNTATFGTAAYIVANGNLGIGASSPGTKLEISATSAGATAEVLRLNNPGSGANTAAQIKFLAAGTNYGTITGGYGVAAPQTTFDLPVAGNYVWQQASAESMRLDASGNLLVGATANPGVLNKSVVINSGANSLAGIVLQNNATGTGSTDGSHITIAAADLIITNAENAPIFFKTNNTERMRITAAGNVLVGTTTAHNKLTVSVSSANAAAGVLSLVNPNDGVGTAADLDFVIHSSATLATGRIRGLAAGADNYPLSFWTYGSGGLAERMRLTNAGNLGIGTSSPGSKLTVTSTSSTALLIEKNSFPETYNPATFSSKNAYMPSGTQENWGTQSSVSTVASYLVDITAYNTTGATDVYFGAVAGPYTGAGGPANFVFGRRTNTQTWAETMRITDTGDVGIGTTTPGYKLEVNGSFAATTKSFVIDHPTKPDMKLRYGSLEGPENGVYIRGKLNGKNIIELPDYWTGLVDEDTITVNLTPIGRKQDLFVKDISNNQINIGGTNVYCFFTVFAERKDVEKLIVELNNGN